MLCHTTIQLVRQFELGNELAIAVQYHTCGRFQSPDSPVANCSALAGYSLSNKA